MSRKTTVLMLLLTFITINGHTYDCNRVISLGWEEYKPLQYEEGKNNVIGFDIELAKAIIENMGCKVRYVKSPRKRHMLSLDKGVIDLAASITKNKEQFAYFSNSYRKGKISIFVKSSDIYMYKFKKLSDIENQDFKLGVQSSTSYGKEFTKLSKNIKFTNKIVEFADLQTNIKKLISGNINGFLGEITPVKHLLLQSENNKLIINMKNLIITNNYYFMFSKKSVDKELVAAFNISLKELKNNGTYKKLFNKYLNS